MLAKAVVASILIVALTVLPTRSAQGSFRLVALVLVGVIISLGLNRALWDLEDRVLPARELQVVKSQLAHTLQRAKEHDGSLQLVVLEGGSAGSRAIDGAAIEQELTPVDPGITVVQFSLPGANRFSRYQMVSDFWERLDSGVKSRIDSVVIVLEVFRGYDVAPLSQLSKNAYSHRSLYYATLANLIHATRAKWLLLSAEQDDGSLGLFFRHVALFVPRIGLQKEWAPYPKIQPATPFRPIDQPKRSYAALNADVTYLAKLAESEQSEPWVSSIMVPRLERVFSGLPSKILFAATPVTDERYAGYAHAFCSRPEHECLVAPADGYYWRIDGRTYFYDPIHLTTKGAQVFSKVLADRLSLRLEASP